MSPRKTAQLVLDNAVRSGAFDKLKKSQIRQRADDLILTLGCRARVRIDGSTINLRAKLLSEQHQKMLVARQLSRYTKRVAVNHRSRS
jgi:Tfp pilus assembly pilus retraction ATPase PilT